MLMPLFFKGSSQLSERFYSKIHSIEGWLSDEVAELLYWKARSISGRGVVVEIGSWKGKSTACLSLGVEASGKNAVIYAVDPHKGSQEHHHLFGDGVDTSHEFLQNIDQLGLNNVELLKMTSKEASRVVPQNVELLWVDGSHDYKDVKADFDIWYPRIVPGGWILFHDSKWPGVRRVLWEDLYLQKEIGTIKRVEDTTYAQVLAKPRCSFRLYNRGSLIALKMRQWIKRKKRKVRKRLQKLHR